MTKPCSPMSLLIVLAIAAWTAVARAENLSPEETLKRYLSALQEQQFDKAYDLISKAMKTDRRTGQVKSKEVWAKEWQYLFSFSEVKIFDFQVMPAKVEGEKAIVPNLLSSQDKYLNQLGVEEYELYTLLKEGGAWKVDQQQQVVEQSEITQWFPKRSANP